MTPCSPSMTRTIEALLCSARTGQAVAELLVDREIARQCAELIGGPPGKGRGADRPLERGAAQTPDP